MKAVTFIIASPDEVMNLLLDEKQRDKWDMRVKSASKESESCIKVVYGTETPLTETIKFSRYVEGQKMII